MDLTPVEVRVTGCLIEKQRTTPDQYPLSLNSLRLACNQSTNRDPVVDYDESTIRQALGNLGRRRWVRSAHGEGSRTLKYRHLLKEALPLPDDEMAVLAVLMLRGVQTPGELKQRAARMHPFGELAGVLAALESLIERELVVRLPRAPGQKEERFGHLLGADESDDGEGWSAPEVPGAPEAAEATTPAGLEDRVAALERQVAEIRELLDR